MNMTTEEMLKRLEADMIMVYAERLAIARRLRLVNAVAKAWWEGDNVAAVKARAALDADERGGKDGTHE